MVSSYNRVKYEYRAHNTSLVCVPRLRDGHPVHRGWYHRLRAHEEYPLSGRRCRVSDHALAGRD